MPPRAISLASSGVRPPVMQPGKSGKLTPKPLSGSCEEQQCNPSALFVTVTSARFAVRWTVRERKAPPCRRIERAAQQLTAGGGAFEIEGQQPRHHLLLA